MSSLDITANKVSDPTPGPNIDLVLGGGLLVANVVVAK